MFNLQGLKILEYQILFLMGSNIYQGVQVVYNPCYFKIFCQVSVHVNILTNM